MDYPNLFKPIVIAGTMFKNRISSSPIGHPDTSITGEFSDDAIAFYERKAQGGCAIVTLGEAVVDSVHGKRYSVELSLDAMRSKRTLARVSDRISRYGAVPSIELQHAGMCATPGVETLGLFKGSEHVYGPSACEFRGNKIEEMPEDLILETIDKFASAAKFVQDMGFGMVTVHGGHGWLINQFFSEDTNHRTDKWGGSAENRARLAVEVCDAIHKKCGKNFPVEMRISASEVIAGGYGVEEGIKLAKALEGHADIIHCSVGGALFSPESYRNNTVIHPSMFREDGMNVKYAAEVRKHVKTPIATVGALADPDLMEEIIATGKADIVAMARELICDPDMPNKARTGRKDEVVKCMRCFSCFSNGMEKGSFWCALNPETNREQSFNRGKEKAIPKKVLVVGGGIGGMEAALTAAKNGHQVILCEKNDRLGGHIRCEEKVPFKKHLNEYILQREMLIGRTDIDVRLGVEVTPEYAKEVGADVIIAALGSRPLIPNIPGIDGANVISADDAYISPEKLGAKSVILGAGLVGSELAIYLHSLGKDVTVVEMAEKVNAAGNSLQQLAVETCIK
ncbi:MAG: FAD-dependent oxidoreductase, partial [Parasporobacterium sp.]|nr:FAD-dependent oxidoreductase [Parasporobacterium sp.]